MHQKCAEHPTHAVCEILSKPRNPCWIPDTMDFAASCLQLFILDSDLSYLLILILNSGLSMRTGVTSSNSAVMLWWSTFQHHGIARGSSVPQERRQNGCQQTRLSHVHRCTVSKSVPAVSAAYVMCNDCVTQIEFLHTSFTAGSDSWLEELKGQHKANRTEEDNKDGQRKTKIIMTHHES